MIAKVAVFLAVVALAYGGVVTHVANPVVTYAAAHHVVAAPVARTVVAHHAQVLHTPVVHAPAVTYAAAPAVIPAPVAYAAPAKVVHTIEPVEQHGYKIAY